MNGSSGPFYYWDACVYIAWLKRETSHGDECMRAIESIAKDNFELKNTIFTSVLTRSEVLESNLTAEENDKFLRSFKPPNHIPQDVDIVIADKARELRGRFKGAPKPLTTPDAIHLATAIIYGAQEFHTFDDGQKDKKAIGLLKLNGDSRVDGLKICKPFLPQGLLSIPTS